MSRDNQRSKAYNAEYALRNVLSNANGTSRTFDFYGSMLTLPEERKFGDVEAVRRYVNSVLGLNWVRATWPRTARFSCAVRARKGQGKAHYSPSKIEIAVPVEDDWALREIVVLHEIAHHLTPGTGHGSAFCGTLVLLVSEIIGPEAGLVLRHGMDVNGCSVDNIVSHIA